MTRLTETLAAQLKLLEELLALLERETRELTGINLEAMAEINGLKEEATLRIEAHADSLRLAIGEAAVAMGLAPDSPLGELAAMLRKRGNKEVPRLHQELTRSAKRLRRTAKMNSEIAERFVTTVGQSLSFLLRLVNRSTVYGESGGYRQRQVGAVMISMEA